MNKNIGKNIVLFNKYFICGPWNMLPLFLGSLLLFIFTQILFVKYVVDLFPSYINYIQYITYVVSVYYFIRGFISDPGIIPREHSDYSQKDIELSTNETKTECDMLEVETNQVINNNQTIQINEENKDKTPYIFTERECKTCNVKRPPGASHCRVCDNCILNFDQ